MTLEIKKRSQGEDPCKQQIIAISIVLGICLLALGLVIGFLVKENLYSYKGYTHPEMFDQNGNILPDENYSSTI